MITGTLSEVWRGKMDERGGGWMSGSVAHILIMWNDISSREERERQRGDQEESINHFTHQHKSHFLQEILLRVMRWTTSSANLVSALPVLVNWEFGNYQDLISISRLGWWIFKQLRYGFAPQGAITVSHQLNQLSPQTCTVKIIYHLDWRGTDETWFTLRLGLSSQFPLKREMKSPIVLCLTCNKN